MDSTITAVAPTPSVVTCPERVTVERGRAAGAAPSGGGLVGVGAPAAGIAADRTDPDPQEGLPLGRDAGRQGQGRRPASPAGADILLGVAAVPTPGEDPEPRDRPELELETRARVV